MVFIVELVDRAVVSVILGHIEKHGVPVSMQSVIRRPECHTAKLRGDFIDQILLLAVPRVFSKAISDFPCHLFFSFFVIICFLCSTRTAGVE